MSDMDFTILWNSYSEDLNKFFINRTRTEDDAEDLFQELFIRLFAQIKKNSDIEYVKQWLYRAAKNILIDYYRKTGYKSEVTLEEDLIHDTPDPSYFLDVKSSYEGLDIMIKDLPSEYESILRETDLADQTVGEYAKSKGISINTAKSKLRRARLALRELLFTCCDFHFDNQGNLIDYIKKD